MRSLSQLSFYHYQWLTPYQKNRTTLVCLHGFTGTLHTFQSVFPKSAPYNVLGIDLPGHGQTPSECLPEVYTMPAVIEEIVQLTAALGLTQFSLLGYSMGARLALALALTYPQKVQQLFLESGSPGLATRIQRQARIQKDHQLAERLLTEPLVQFVNFWENLSLFATQKNLPSPVQTRIRQERLAQNPLGLASSLWYMGTGAQTSFWSRLSELAMVPTNLLVGSEDRKFIGIARQMQAEQSSLHLMIFPKSGHCIHLEQPAAFYTYVTERMEGGRENEN